MKRFRFGIKLRYALILALAFILLGNRGFRNLIANYREYRVLTAKKLKLEGQRAQLAKQLKNIGENPAVEQAARRELGLIRPGETEYRFPPPKDSDK
ncbi:MAG TPA: septum formation initiator family protein [Elusimicrobiales bacterium]|nr:septum formation initiator family protein [Elusimicrobiales bacterium]